VKGGSTLQSLIEYPPAELSVVLPNSNYFMKIQIIESDGNICGSCVYESTQLGGFPIIEVDDQPTVVRSSVNMSWYDEWITRKNIKAVLFSC
jgi:hypothetical protein